jgi:hypothetical protein
VNPDRDFDLVVVIDRAEVEVGDTAPAMSTLSKLLSSVQTIRSFQNGVDVAFHGYDSDPRELFDITEVREFVYELDLLFPYWLYFLRKTGNGLQALAFCLRPPHLKDGQRLVELVERRWGPALFDLMGRAGFSESEAERAFAEAGHYFLEGPRRPLSIDEL